MTISDGEVMSLLRVLLGSKVPTSHWAGTSPLGTAFPMMAEEDYILIGIAIASTLILAASYGL